VPVRVVVGVVVAAAPEEMVPETVDWAEAVLAKPTKARNNMSWIVRIFLVMLFVVVG
jgi:hypothetical protein